MSFKKVDNENKERPDGKVCILVYGYEDNEFMEIKNFAFQLGIETSIKVNKNSSINTLNHLIHEKELQVDDSKFHNEKAIVLNAISDFELNSFLTNFKNLGIKRPLFAVVTETSINWTFYDLLSDLMEERQKFIELHNKK